MTAPTGTQPHGAPALADLQPRVRGRVLLPGSDGFEAAATPWNVAVPQRPAAVVEVADASDVVAVVDFCRVHGLRVSAQPGGHGATEALSGSVLLRTGALDEVWVDADARVARVGAGVKWGALLEALAGTGLVALAGSNPDVSVVGYLLGGGLSWFSRRYGVAARSLRAVELVDATGAHRWVTEESDADLMWALRGGGGEFGIVTRVEVALQPEPELYGGKLMFPIADSPAVLAAFTEVTASAPDGLTCWATVMHFPNVADLPEPVRGKSFATVDATWLGPAAQAEALLAPIRAAGTVVSDSIAPVPINRLGDVAAEPTAPTPAIDWSAVLARFDAPAITRLLDAVADPARTALNVIQIRHLGGALQIRSKGIGGATDTVGGNYLVFAFGIPAVPQLVEPIRGSIQTLAAAVAPDVSGHGTLTFLGTGMPRSSAHDDEVLARLRAVKGRVDPHGIIRGNHPLD